jgi:hypothetical protein
MCNWPPRLHTISLFWKQLVGEHRHVASFNENREPMVFSMNTNSTFASAGEFQLRARFVLVNVPRANAHCALCCRKIEKGYVRESQTRLLYCDTQCFTGHTKMAVLAIENVARRVS